MPVVVQGAATARKALRQINPDVAKESQKEVATLLKSITTKAKGFLPSASPMSGWSKEQQTGKWATRAFDASVIRRGITYSTAPTRPNKSGFRSVATIYNKSAAGAIYETAGRKSGISGNFTPHIKGAIKGVDSKKRGRLIFAAWAQDNGKVQEGVVKALEKSIHLAVTTMRKGK